MCHISFTAPAELAPVRLPSEHKWNRSHGLSQSLIDSVIYRCQDCSTSFAYLLITATHTDSNERLQRNRRSHRTGIGRASPAFFAARNDKDSRENRQLLLLTWQQLATSPESPSSRPQRKRGVFRNISRVTSVFADRRQLMLARCQVS